MVIGEDELEQFAPALNRTRWIGGMLCTMAGTA